MQNPARDLWPDDISQPADIQTPLFILKEQAAFLGQKTNNLVEGQVATDPTNTGFIHTFYLVAPALGGYKYGLFKVAHPIDLYPASINFEGKWVTTKSQEEFIEQLKEVFAHNKTKSVIQALKAQSQQ